MEAALMIRAAAHATSPVIRPAQRWRNKVTDLEVARVMYQLEAGLKLTRGTHRWYAPEGHRLATGTRLTMIVDEMIRTGLVREYRYPQQELIPAPVHLQDGTGSEAHSACLFAGEDIGAMRARLVAAEYFTLVDCLGCEQAVATGRTRGL